jgi:two-component system osmolarity sensor histidine kinase EnvZ
MRSRIERSREQRTLLLSGVSHDLRTPLTRLKLGLSLSPDDPETEAMLGDVSDMEHMLEGFLAFVRGEAEDETEPVVPTDLARRLVENAARVGRKVDLSLGPGAGTPVEMREKSVERALENLVQNALRYGATVTLAVAVDKNWLRFVVEDDGPGIPEDRREEALRPFARLDPARNRSRGEGAGLGLAIAMDVARGHGGRLDLSDSPLGGLRAELALAR